MVVLIIVILALGAIMGWTQGALKQIAHMAGIVVGLFVACMLYKEFAGFLTPHIGSSETTGQFIAFVLLVVLVPVACGIVASVLTKFLNIVHLGFLNRLGGVVVGVVTYCALLSFIFNIMDFLESEGGFSPDKLGERPALFYFVKHSAQAIVPDAFIVDDMKEMNDAVDAGEEVHRGLMDVTYKVSGDKDEAE